MAWDNSQVYTLGLLMTPAIMTQMAANDQFLYDRVANYSVLTLDEASNPTTTNTSFTTIGSSLVSIAIDINYGVAEVGFNGVFYNNTNGAFTFVDFTVDGTPHGGDDGIVNGLQSATPSRIHPFTFVRIVDGLSAASHTFTVIWKVSTGTATLWAGAGTSNEDTHPQFWVKEVIQ